MSNNLIVIPKADIRVIDMIGRPAGNWTILRRCERPEGKAPGAYWWCRCVCGAERAIPGATLRRDGSLQCKHCSSTTHGDAVARSPEYRAWCSMRSRCLSPTHKQYKDYGGRGILICERWDSFEAFVADVGRRPAGRYSLDRFPNNDGNYEPGNCRWATSAQQARNRRNNRKVVLDGSSVTLQELSEATGLSYDTLVYRHRVGTLRLPCASRSAR